MIRRKRLYRKALATYRQGYLDGTQARIAAERRQNKAVWNAEVWDEDDTPAYTAGRNLGARGTGDPDRLPLDVWVRVLAKAQEPR